MTLSPSQINSALTRMVKASPQSNSWKFICGMGVSIGLFCFSPNARAAESVLLRFESTQVTVPVENLRNFVTTGEARTPNLQQFLQEHPKAQQALVKVLSKEITISPSASKEFASRPIGEFILVQLEKFLRTPAQSAGLENLRISLNSALKEDNSFSILELMEKYPNPSIDLDVAGLERAYRNISAFVERIQPALETVKATLQDLICDCPQTQQAQSSQPQSNIQGTDELKAKQSQCPDTSTTPLSNQKSLIKNQTESSIQLIQSITPDNTSSLKE